MFIEKISHIKGIGNYKDFTASAVDYSWDGVLNKNTFIYAENASGKTTLAQIIKSLSTSSDIEEVCRRKTFDYQTNPSIQVSIRDNNSIVDDFNGKTWAHRYNNIVVFDSYFVERNVYVISPSKKTGDEETINLLLGEDNLKIYDRIAKLKMQLSSLGGIKGNLIHVKKQLEERKQLGEIASPMNNQEEGVTLEQVEEKIKAISLQIFQNKDERKKLRQQLNSSKVPEKYISATNRYLSIFAPDIELVALYMKTKSMITYGVKIKGHMVRSNIESTSLKRIFSDGEKNAVAFSFFLAKLELLPDLDKYLVVFDDPLSSMDATRRSSSIYQLCLLAKKVSQFILLSHDKLFVRDIKDIARRCGIEQDQQLVLKIGKTEGTSAIMGYDIDEDTKTGIAKEIEMVLDFRDNGDKSKYSADNVAESIRKVVEGFLRLKYSASECFKKAKTLGAMITVIEKNEESTFSYDKKHVDELKEINFYSCNFHHLDPGHERVGTNNTELKNYCKRTLNLLLHL